MVARRHAARRLEIEQPVLDAVQRQQLPQHEHERRPRHGRADGKLTKGTVEAVEMRLGIDQTAGAHMDHLIDAVGELIAAILDMDRGIGMAQIATVHIGKARHHLLPRDIRRAIICRCSCMYRGSVPRAPKLRPAFAQPSPRSARSLEVIPSARSLRCSAERSMPMKAAVLEILPPKRLTWASR